MAEFQGQDVIAAAAGAFLGNPVLIERGRRLRDLGRWVADFSELAGLSCGRRAIDAAAWFHDAWCAEGVRKGALLPEIPLAESTTELQLDESAAIVQRQLADVLDSGTRSLAATAIRESARRETRVTEAIVLREAVNLDSIGPLWVLGQMARCRSQDRPISAIVAAWERQVEYQYWTRRIAETLQFERSRVLARHRLEALDAFMMSLRDQLTSGDRHVAPGGG